MKHQVIQTEEEYQKALNRLEMIFHTESDTKEKDELEALLTSIEKYETNTVGDF